ncbi:MAG: ParB/RepB/Spo0J family partition protein [Ruminococcus sp.]|nr:ParB/RepB/Spo0J family partition protein [Ruminococcus sp.]MBS5453296.1 ParB/RepB/Spo0J family partition protein [Ruminococcus sp.]
MAKNSVAGLLTSVDELFTTQKSRDEAKLERIINLSPDKISDYPNHPFQVRMDEDMEQMAESVREHGILVPALVRPKPDGGYEMIAGHRRKCAAKLAELSEIPCIVRDLTDDEAVIVMVDSNLQREKVLPSERAFAYQMRMEAMERRQGKRNDLTSANDLQKLSQRQTSRDKVAEKAGKSHETIRLYICLTNLIPELLELVDNSVLKDKEKLKIALRPAVELSYLKNSEQQDVFQIIQNMECTPSHAQTIKMRKMSKAKKENERLDRDVFISIMEEEKPNQKEQFRMPRERISRYFAPGTPAQKIEDTIIKALELYRKRQRSLER